jgi:phenylalanyl-tRNA synthetase alpha chain
MEQKLNSIRQETLDSIKSASQLDELEEIRVRVLGRKGLLTQILRTLGELSPEQRTTVGKLSNEIKKVIEDTLDLKVKELETSSFGELISSEWIDVTLNPELSIREKKSGYIHPISQTQYEIENILTSMDSIYLTALSLNRVLQFEP